MSSLKGNKDGVILKDPLVRQDAYKEFCDHLAKGKAIKSWFYEKEGHRCCWATMLSYIENKSEFDPLTKTISEAKGYQHWESIVEASATGCNKEANTASLQMLMRNKFGWDKKEDSEEKVSPLQDFNDLLHENMLIKAELAAYKESNANKS